MSKPAKALRFLQRFCPPQLLEEIEGDLLQRYERDVKRVGERKAKLRLWWNVIRFMRPGIVMRNKLAGWSNHVLPFHYLHFFLRTASRSKLYTLINLISLTAGLACSLLTFLWAENELTFDKFHSEREKIFAIKSNFSFEQGISTYPSTPGNLAGALEAFPEWS